MAQLDVGDFGSPRTCTYTWAGSSPEEVAESDIKLNSVDKKWTVKPNAASCSRRWDIQSIMTHERLHTFGLAHVPENTAGSQSVSSRDNGPCQASERSLGKGDSIGLRERYR